MWLDVVCQVRLNRIHNTLWLCYLSVMACLSWPGQPSRQAQEAEEGLQGVHRRLRRNGHPKTKEGCKKFGGKQAGSPVCCAYDEHLAPVLEPVHERQQHTHHAGKDLVTAAGPAAARQQAHGHSSAAKQVRRQQAAT
jgi:hypothetical protein